MSLTRCESILFPIVISVLIYCLKIFGLAPFSLSIKKSSCKNSNRYCCSTKVFLYSRIGMAYGVLILVLVSVTLGPLFPRLFSMNYKHSSLLSRAIDSSQGIFCLSTVFIIITTWTFNQNKAVRIMNRIFEIDVKLQSSENKQPFNYKSRSLLFAKTHAVLNVFLWICILSTEMVQLIIPDNLVNWVFFTVPTFVIYCFTVEYFVVVGLVASELKIFNNNLSNLHKFRNCYSFNRPSFLNEHLTAWNLSIHNQLEALHSLHNIRTEISDICKDIAEFFSFPILACLAYGFFSLVYNVYYLIAIIVLEDESIPISDCVNVAGWILLSLYPSGLLFFNVTETVTEAKLTRRLVHKLLSTAVKEEIKAELELFSLQLLHENIDFTAYGFFKLDFTVLHSILGATATYLVILIQFQSQ